MKLTFSKKDYLIDDGEQGESDRKESTQSISKEHRKVCTYFIAT
jgi:hypothetical protein